jgi:hypothetical protein
MDRLLLTGTGKTGAYAKQRRQQKKNQILRVHYSQRLFRMQHIDSTNWDSPS